MERLGTLRLAAHALAASAVRYFGLTGANQDEDRSTIVSAWASGTPAYFGRRAKRSVLIAVVPWDGSGAERDNTM